MASYVKYETPKDVATKALEALTVANDTGRVRKGANETTKSIESGNSKLVLIASDVEPQEVVMHLPEICKEKEVPFVFIATKKELGEAISIPVSCAACSIEKAGNGSEMLKAVCDKVLPLCGIIPSKGAKHTEKPKKEATPKKEKPKEQKKEDKPKKDDKKSEDKKEKKSEEKKE